MCLLLSLVTYSRQNWFVTHQIETSGNPVRQAVRRVPLPKREEVKKLLTEMQEKDIITPSKSPWSQKRIGPFVFVLITVR